MWDGFVAVDTSYSPPVYEGARAFFTVHNVGPGSVMVKVWDRLPGEPDLTMQSPHNRAVRLRAGDTRTITAGMLVIQYLDDTPARPYAAVGWRLMGVVRWMP
jgi:hypothetical protein